MERSEGNESLIAREPIVTANGVRYIPRLSGNALRHCMVREPLARFMIDRWGLSGTLSLRQANFLFHGGTLTESNGRVDTAAINRAYLLFPSVHLLGGCLPDAILPGSMAAHFGMLVCRENASRVEAMLPPGISIPENLRQAEAFVGGWQYTRGDAGKDLTVNAKAAGEGGKGDSSLMIFSGQAVIPGAVFAHGFMLQHVSEIDLGAALTGIYQWRANGASVGGMSARGHGVLDTLIAVEGVDVAGVMDSYRRHVDQVRDEAVAWLNATFAQPVKTKKGAHAVA